MTYMLSVLWSDHLDPCYQFCAPVMQLWVKLCCLMVCVCDSWGTSLNDWLHSVHRPGEPEVPGCFLLPKEALSCWLPNEELWETSGSNSVTYTPEFLCWTKQIVSFLGCCCFSLLLPIPISLGSTSLVSHLHLNPSLRVYLWETLPETVRL